MRRVDHNNIIRLSNSPDSGAPIALFEMDPATTINQNHFRFGTVNSFSPTTPVHDEREWHTLFPHHSINTIPSSSILSVDVATQASSARAFRPPSFTQVVQIHVQVDNRMWSHRTAVPDGFGGLRVADR